MLGYSIQAAEAAEPTADGLPLVGLMS